MAAADLTAAQLRELLHYDPETGIFTSLVRNRKLNRAVGADNCGYQRIYAGGKYHRAHRLAWLYMTGTWPTIIDHINGDRRDNRWQNLREATVAVNTQNVRSARADSVSGVLGVKRTRSGKFAASISATLAGVRVHLYLGAYETSEQASAVFVEAKRRLHDGCVI